MITCFLSSPYIYWKPLHLFSIGQVDHGLWDGCYFLINAGHVLQAGTHPGGALPEDKMQPFADMKLDKLSFQEYSHEHPHEQYTVGFAGRPGNISFQLCWCIFFPYLIAQSGTKAISTVAATTYPFGPGGPDFYINKIDYTETNGPGGQHYYVLHEEADPCFGKVVKGTYVIDRISSLPTDIDDGILQNPVHILKATILPNQHFCAGVANIDD